MVELVAATAAAAVMKTLLMTFFPPKMSQVEQCIII
jgi:hypothetical protein